MKYQTIGLVLLYCLICGYSAVLIADPELPLLGENASFNIKKEVDLGRGLYNKLKEQGYVIDDPLLSRYLQDIGESLLTSLDVRVRDYHFYLVKDDSVNAFAAPGGYIGVHLGLINVSASEDELASVLAHEIAHVELMHSMQMIEKAQSVNMASVISLLAAILISGQDVEAASAIIYAGVAGSAQTMINFTRENEYEADRVGVEVLKKSEYDPRAMADFMKLLQSREQGGELAGIEYLRTHPVNSNRIAEITSRLSSLPNKPPKFTRYQQFKDYLFYMYPDINQVNSHSRFAVALELTRNGRYELAEKIYQELLQIDPDSLWFNSALAENLQYRRQFPAATRIYKSMLLLYPEDIAITTRLVKVLLVQEQPDIALNFVQQLHERYKAQPGLYRLYGDIYRQLDNDPLMQLAEANFHWYSGNKKQAKIQFKALLSEKVLDTASAESVKEKLDTD